MIDVVAIDGPVGAGKSSVARLLAARLGWRHLDTGAMYRAVALAALERGASLADVAACGELARAMGLAFEPGAQGQRVLMNGRDVTEAIRSPQISEGASMVGDLAPVREELGRRQRELGQSGRCVAEGRDMGTVIFPGARWKFYLDADPRERARRRGDELARQGKPQPESELLASVAQRDRRDRSRGVGALRVAEDAIVIDTTGMDLGRVVAILEAIIRAEGSANP